MAKRTPSFLNFPSIPFSPFSLLAFSLFFLPLISQQSFATEDSPKIGRSEFQRSQRFTPVRLLNLEQKETLKSIVDSTVRIDSINGRCTATRIHPRGDLLTARHCVQGCLIQQKVYRTQVDSKSVEYYVVDSSRLGKAECLLKINGADTPMIVQHVSPFFIDRFSEQALKMLNRELYDQLRNDGALSSGDFAILSPLVSHTNESEKNSQSSICLSAEDIPQELFTIGFPSETKRDSFNSNGVEMYFSSGRLLQSFAEGVCYQEAHEKNRKGLLAQFDEAGTFVSTVDAIYGSSGSAVYGSPGSIVGILTNMYAPYDRDPKKLPEVHYCEGAAKALQSKRILQFIGPEAAKMYRCEVADQE